MYRNFIYFWIRKIGIFKVKSVYQLWGSHNKWSVFRWKGTVGEERQRDGRKEAGLTTAPPVFNVALRQRK